MDKIRVFIADDHRMLREGLTLYLNIQSDIEIVGETFKKNQISEYIHDLQPDILLLDVMLLDSDDEHPITSFCQASPKTKIIMLSSQNSDEYVHRTLKDGASGFIDKQAPSADIVNAIHQVMNGHYYLSPTILNRVIETFLEGTRTKPRGHKHEHDRYHGYNQLSEREKQVFQYLLEGCSSKDISQALNISPKTVDKHRTNIFKKTGVENSTQLLHYAIKLEIISDSRAV